MMPCSWLLSFQAAYVILLMASLSHVVKTAEALTNPKKPKATTKSASSSSSRGSLDFKTLFKPEYSENVPNLSSTRIVSMIPTATISSTSSSSSSSPLISPLRQELFTSPIISTLYERILPPLWEAGLRIGGPEKEFASAMLHICGHGNGKSNAKNNNNDSRIVLDLSCGTGFVGRRMAASGEFQHVFALDYSPQMLGECISSIQREKETDLPISIIRGDAGNLPFQDNILDAIHWGAAMHCVPDAEQALAEVYRVLKPGGKLYATTFLKPFPDIVFRFFTVSELERLSQNAGFNPKSVFVEGRGVYGIIRAIK